MIFQIDRKTGQRLSENITIEQAKNLTVLDYIDLEVTNDATVEERAFVTKYRLKNEIDIEELLDIVAGNKNNTDLKNKIKEIRDRVKPKGAARSSSKKK